MKNTKVFTLLSLAAVGGILASCASKEQVSSPLSFIPRASLRADLKEDFINKGSQVYYKENGEIIKINDPDDPAVNTLDELKISAPVLSIYYSTKKTGAFQDEVTLSVTGYPKKASIGTITWSSSDPAIATVDQNGKVTAVSEGLSVITASSSAGKSVSSKVYVNSNDALGSTIKESADAMMVRQASGSFVTPTEVRVDETYVQTKKSGDSILSSTKFSQSMWASQKDAYFRIASNDEQVLTSGGSIVPSNSAYVFYTTKDYTSYIFCTSSGKSNYMTLDQSSLVDKGKKPFDGLAEVLQSFFVSGSKIMTSQFEDLLGSDELGGDYSGAKYRGTFGKDSGEFAYRKISINGGRVGAEDAAELDIPVNTMVSITDDISYLFADDLLKSKIIAEKIEYEIGDVPYIEEINVVYTYEARNVDIWWPDATQFSKVDTIFDL